VRRRFHFPDVPVDVIGEAELVDLAQFIKGIRVDMRYATTRNFTGRVLYASPRPWLREPVARQLAAAQAAAAGHGLGLKVWDAYRPAEAQRLMWAACPDPNFVAPPERGSRHTRGAAVDVTLVRLDDGAELPMGSDFDDFSTRAARDYAGLEPPEAANRALLTRFMTDAGFTGIRTEWWHYDAEGWERWPLIDALD
jgi:D-alanyl-D-alanine dipeptidase